MRTRRDTPLLVGAVTHSFGTGYVYNSALLIRASGEVAGRYDKRRPVIFSEYIPLGDRYPEWEEAVRGIMTERLHITAGDKTVLLGEPPLRAGILLCSEELDPDLAGEAAAHGANLLVGMANGAWFGDAPALSQQLALATFRAVETRRQLVRVTNTGITAHIDALGRVQFAGPVTHVRQGEVQPATHFVREVSLLQTASLGRYTVSYFPYACLGLLIAAAARAGCLGSKWRSGRRRGRRRPKRSHAPGLLAVSRVWTN
jgi:apolipoprotein N-acyltransferase